MPQDGREALRLWQPLPANKERPPWAHVTRAWRSCVPASRFRSDVTPAELAALARLCERKGLNARETTAVLAVALMWAPGLPRDPKPLLRSSSMTA